MIRDYNIGDRVRFCNGVHSTLEEGTVTGYRDSTNPMKPGLRFIVRWDGLTDEDVAHLPVLSYRAEALILVSRAPATV